MFHSVEIMNIYSHLTLFWQKFRENNDSTNKNMWKRQTLQMTVFVRVGGLNTCSRAPRLVYKVRDFSPISYHVLSTRDQICAVLPPFRIKC